MPNSIEIRGIEQGWRLRHAFFAFTVVLVPVPVTRS
jgi:hypothetical protein